MLEFISSQKIEIIAIVIALIAFIVPIYKYLLDREVQLQDARFKLYHGLIKSLVEPELQRVNVIDPQTKLQHNVYGKMMDRQIATIFEMRNFPEYFEVTERILNGLKNKWEAEGVYKPIINELCYTLTYIKIYQRCLYKFLRWTWFLSFIPSCCIHFEMGRVKY